MKNGWMHARTRMVKHCDSLCIMEGRKPCSFVHRYRKEGKEQDGNKRIPDYIRDLVGMMHAYDLNPSMLLQDLSIRGELA